MVEGQRCNEEGGGGGGAWPEGQADGVEMCVDVGSLRLVRWGSRGAAAAKLGLPATRGGGRGAQPRLPCREVDSEEGQLPGGIRVGGGVLLFAEALVALRARDHRRP